MLLGIVKEVLNVFRLKSELKRKSEPTYDQLFPHTTPHLASEFHYSSPGGQG